MSTLSTFTALAGERIQDTEGVLSSGEVQNAVAEALATYSKHRPQTLVADLAGDDDYDYALPAAFVVGRSAVVQLEYPAGEREPVLLEASEWQLYQSASTTTVLRFLSVTPATGETARLTYTAPHVVDGSGSTVPAPDEVCVGNLAAAVACEWLSSHYSQQGDPSLSADTTDHTSKAANYAMRAKRFRALGLAHLGIVEGKDAGGAASAPVGAASAVRDWDTDLSNNAGDRLTHPRRYR